MIDIPEKWSEELAEESGWHVGDGSMNIYKGRGFYQLRGHITDDREHYIQRIKPIFKELYDLDISLREMKSTGVYGFQIWNNALVEFKNKKVHLPLGKKIDYRIPEEIKKNKELTKAFIRGVFDTDGCVYIENKRGKLYPRMTIQICCKQLSSDITELCLALGIRATRHTHERKERNWSTIYEIAVRGIEMTEKWMNTIQPRNPKHIKRWERYKTEQ